MAHLTLAGASDDGRELRLVDEEGREHTLPVTPALRSALGVPAGGSSRPGPQEHPMDSALRPRDIQARIRAGESAEALAQAAGSSVEKIMVYAGPVLAEREHVAQRAMASSLRRGGEGARTLGEAVSAHLRARDVDPGGVDWDAWRREDGRWTLIGGYATPERQGIATFSYDVPGNFVTLEDDDARWLVGETVTEPAGAVATAPAHDDLSARRRRLAAVADEVPLGSDVTPGEELGDDVLEILADPDPAPERVDADAEEQPALDLGPAGSAATPAGQPVPTADRDDDRDATEDEPAAEEPPRRPVQKKRGRASVPSWDEIMFGGGDR
ncbi:septation protein SepH [Nocardioides nanhaiensis]|uniref:Septation protein SepH n=1 Tax=Nocardioides nanhaiensis TaxID=1476871 RepID=A0ABP8X0E2_9ACTN